VNHGLKWNLIIICLLMCLSTALLNGVVTEGEKLTFSINYGIIKAAEATLETQSDILFDRPVWVITSRAKTYPFFDSVFKVRDIVQSWWDKENLHALRFSKRLSEGKYKQYRVHTYDHENQSSIYQSWNFKKQEFKTKQIKIPSGTQDILSAFYSVRQLNLIPGSKTMVDITVDGNTYRTEVVVHRRETINSIFGKMECLVIEPKLKSEGVFKQSGRILIWVTDDQYKVPLKMTSQITFGAFTAIIRAAENVPYTILQK